MGSHRPASKFWLGRWRYGACKCAYSCTIAVRETDEVQFVFSAFCALTIWTTLGASGDIEHFGPEQMMGITKVDTGLSDAISAIAAADDTTQGIVGSFAL